MYRHSGGKLLSSGQLAALAALEADHDNLRAVLNQSVHSHFGESGALV